MNADSASKPLCLLVVVLGMHRSGTSAVTGALSRLGFPLGGPALPAADDNPLGYFENAEAVDINEGLLLALGRGWDDLRGLPDGWQASAAAQHARHRIHAWVDGIEAPEGRCVLKDPRLCLLFPLWREVLESRGIDLRVVLAHRALPEIVASLVKRDALAERHALLLALRHVLEAERASRGLVRAACHYDALLEDPAGKLPSLLADLSIERPGESFLAAALAGFDPMQRHHRLAAVPLLSGLDDLCDAIDLASTHVGDVLAYPDGAVDRVARACLDAASVLQPRADALCAARTLARWCAQEAGRLDAALEAARSLALDRLGEVERLDLQLKKVDVALAACDAERQQVTAAFVDASALAHARLDEIRAATSGLLEAREGLARAEAMAVDRLRSIEGLEAELRHVSEGLARAEAMAVDRLRTIERLEEELRRVREGLGRAESLALERLVSLSALDAALTETRQALYRTESLALERMSRIDILIEERDNLSESVTALGTELASLRASWAWRITAPLRWLAVRLGGRVT